MSPPRRYILDANGQPKPEPDLLTWAQWLETAHRQIGLDTVGDVEVSTVFLGLDHNFERSGPPILWETMTFGSGQPQEQRRCSGSREQAEAMHAEMVEWVKAEQRKGAEK